MTNAEQRAAAKQFVKDWSGKGYEKGEIQLHTLYEFQETSEENKESGRDESKVEGVLQKMGELKHQEKLWAAGETL